MHQEQGQRMSDQPEIEVYTDFEAVYDLPDPRPYFRALRPADYRMPAQTTGYLSRHHAVIAAFLGKTRPRLLDLACGFGTNGALLGHDLALSDLYAYFEADATGPLPEADRRFFAERRREPRPFEIGGLDIARNALDYGLACGLMDRVFDDNLLEGSAGSDLRSFVAETDIIFEVGAVMEILIPGLRALLDLEEASHRPWVLLSPRCDVDASPLWQFLETAGYRVERTNRRPIRYRRLLGEKERALLWRRVEALGRDPTEAFDGDYFALDLYLARPDNHADTVPIGELPFDEEER
jgi:hypothetical protein